MTRMHIGLAAAIPSGVLIVGLLVLILASYQRDIHQARARISAGSRIVETPRGPIEYAVAGDGPPVLVVHGAGGGYDQGLDFTKALVRAARRLAPRAMFRALLGTPPEVVESASADERARAAQVLDHLLPFSQRRLGVHNDASITPFLPRYELERIEAPALILGAADDLYGTFDGARYSARHIRHARFIGYPSGGHILVGQLQEALSETVAFLKRAE